MSWPKKMTMVSPQNFRVEYAINPHMLDIHGNLKQINTSNAIRQWEAYKDILESLDYEVEVLPSVSGFPDMVFCANQIFPFIKDHQTQVILSRMHSDKRQGEVLYFKKWLQEKKIPFHELSSSHSFEGMGDLLWNHETDEAFGGYGFRTDNSIYDEIEDIIKQPVHRLQLVNANFYHLDTCLTILGANTAAIVKEAFDQDSFDFIKSKFPQLIEIPLDEATELLAGNGFCPNGKDVILQAGATQTSQLLCNAGFNVLEVETSEFLKSGGSVFCLKNILF